MPSHSPRPFSNPEHIIMRNGVGLVVAIASLIVPVASRALADVIITSETMTVDGKATQQTLYVTPERRKMDLGGMAVIVRTDTGKIVTLMKEKHEYIEMDPKQISAGVAAVEAQMRQRLQSVPEAQRKQIESMLAQHGVPGGQSKDASDAIKYEKTGETKKVGAWSCTVFRQTRDGELLANLCMAPAAAAGITPDDLAAFRSFGEAMRKSLPDAVRRNVAAMDFDAGARQIGFEGFPVEIAAYLSGKPRATTTVKSIEHRPLTADIFEVPAGYARKEIPGFGQSGAPPSPK
jgi:hypothetical protein